jgi:hydrogenase maturation factor
MLPQHYTKRDVEGILSSIRDVCIDYDITLCGGHSEITDAVNRPIVCGALIGTVKKKNLIDKRNMSTGDVVLLTKRVAVEGTSILAMDFETRLKNSGVDDAILDRSRRLIASIGILKEARIAASVGGTTAMHDVTEGGFATAVRELARAGGHTVQINMEKIPIFEETELICSVVGVDPLGLIGSGSLLICCNPSVVDELIKMLRDNSIEVTAIGEVKERGDSVHAYDGGTEVVFPYFSVDEITKLFKNG